MADPISAFFASIFAGTAATGTAAAGATAVAGTAAAATSGISLAGILSGAASVLGVVNAISAGNEKSDALKAQAADSQSEIPLQTLQGVNRRTALKAQLQDALGQQDTAYAASGTDLSFGTPAQARKDAFREEDNAVTNQVGTEQTNVARLNERTKNYLLQAKNAKSAGYFDAFQIGLKGATSALNRG